VFEAMVARFGPGIVAADGTLDRAAVAALVFPDPAALADLNAIVHPAVQDEIVRQLADAAALPGDTVVVLDIPLLVETGRDGATAGTIVVDCDPEVAVRRLVEQRGFSEGDARARVARQASRAERLARADFVIDNGGTRADLEPRIDACWAWIRSR
jgi:dephospho-CoA kinase